MFKKYRELILYIIIGVLTTAVNYAIYFTLTAIGMYYIAAQVISVAASILFAASMGIGVLFSALPLLIYQRSLTFAAQWLNAHITAPMLDNLSGLGGLIVMAVGLNLLEVADIKTSNILPGVIFVLLFSALT